MIAFVSLVCTPTAVDSLTGLLLALYIGRGFAVRMGNMTSAEVGGRESIEVVLHIKNSRKLKYI